MVAALLCSLAFVAAGAALRGLQDPHARAGPTASCGDVSAADYACDVAGYVALARRDGIPAAFATLRADFDAREMVRHNCHQFAHVIAHAARAPDPRQVLEEGDPLCGSGFYAGRIEDLVSEAAARGAPLAPASVCAPVRRRTPRSNQHHNCAHAVGHGLMGASGNDVQRALRGCDAMADAWERHNCAGGVFMEYLNRSTLRPAAASPPLVPAHPLALCRAVARRFRRACYGQLASYAVQASGGDAARAFARCAAIPERALRAACERGLGADSAWRAIGDHITTDGVAAATAQGCESGSTPESRSHCAVGAVKMLVDHYRDGSVGGRFCELLDGAPRAPCRRAGRAHLVSMRRA